MSYRKGHRCSKGLHGLNRTVRRPTERHWWLIWAVVGLIYFFVGVSLSSDGSPHRRIIAGLFLLVLTMLLVLVGYRTLWEVKRAPSQAEAITFSPQPP